MPFDIAVTLDPEQRIIIKIPHQNRKCDEKALVPFRAINKPLEIFQFLIKSLLNFCLIAQCNPFITRSEAFGYKEIVNCVE